MHESSRVVAALVLSVIGLAGCVTIAIQDGVSVVEIDEAAGLVRVGDPWTEGAVIRRVRYLDAAEIEEYALYDAPAGRVELFYATVTDDRYALADTFTIRRAIERFAFVSGRAVDIGPSGEVSSGPALIFYRPFRLEGAARLCVGFKAAWDDVAYDPERRPSKLFFGYHCAAAGASLDQDTIERAIASVGFTPPTEARLVATTPEAEQAALALARGPDRAGESGLPDFPILLARHYQEDGGEERRDPF